jgi:hypothetical protein
VCVCVCVYERERGRKRSPSGEKNDQVRGYGGVCVTSAAMSEEQIRSQNVDQVLTSR